MKIRKTVYIRKKAKDVGENVWKEKIEPNKKEYHHITFILIFLSFFQNSSAKSFQLLFYLAFCGSHCTHSFRLRWMLNMGLNKVEQNLLWHSPARKRTFGKVPICRFFTTLPSFSLLWLSPLLLSFFIIVSLSFFFFIIAFICEKNVFQERER